MPKSPANKTEDFEFEDFEARSSVDFDDDPSVVEILSPFLTTTLAVIPISDKARGAATTLLDEFTGALRDQRHKRRAQAQAQAQETLYQEEQDRERERRARAQAQAQEEQERQRWDRDHWVEKAILGAARDQARSLEAAITIVGASRKEVEASLRVHIGEQMVATAQFATELINSAIDSKRTQRTQQTKQRKG